MSLYPTLEDMQVDKLVQNQRTMINEIIKADDSHAPISESTISTSLYPTLSSFLGLELSEEVLRQNMPERLQRDTPDTTVQPAYVLPQTTSGALVTAPVTGNNLFPSSAQVNHNIRELILCKDAKGKVGLRVQYVDNGCFVCIVVKNSPAALAGLRFGDQILQVNGVLACGSSVDKIHKLFKTSGNNNIQVVVRDRPFERTVTLIKDSKGNLGFSFSNGKISNIVKDSSAARNGVLTNHNLLEVNGQTVVAMKDKEIIKIIQDSPGNAVKITIIPSFIYDHLVKKLSTSYLRGIMDHRIPEF